MSTETKRQLPGSGNNSSNRADWRLVLLAVAALVVAPFVIYPIFLMKILCFALFACAFNLLLGYVGLLSFGHAAFFGGGAYIAAYTAKAWGLPPELALLAAVVFAAAFGLVMGFLAIRRQGIYFAMITLAMAQMFFFFCIQVPVTGGEDGIQAVPRGSVFGFLPLQDNMAMYTFVAVIFVAAYVAIWRVVSSPFGQILRAIGTNEARAISLGYRVQRYKLAAFVMSAALAGLAGAMKAIVFQLASLTDVGWHTSGDAVLMTLLGGIGTLFGPVVGAALVVGLQSALSTSALPIPVILGAIFVLCVLLFRRGIVGEIRDYLQRRNERRKAQAEVVLNNYR